MVSHQGPIMLITVQISNLKTVLVPESLQFSFDTRCDTEARGGWEDWDPNAFLYTLCFSISIPWDWTSFQASLSRFESWSLSLFFGVTEFEARFQTLLRHLTFRRGKYSHWRDLKWQQFRVETTVDERVKIQISQKGKRTSSYKLWMAFSGEDLSLTW